MLLVPPFREGLGEGLTLLGGGIGECRELGLGVGEVGCGCTEVLEGVLDCWMSVQVQEVRGSGASDSCGAVDAAVVGLRMRTLSMVAGGWWKGGGLGE